MRQLLSLLGLCALVTACVPKNQYDALVTERNYYRNQVVLTDSLTDERAISTYNEVQEDGADLSRRIQQVEQLTATNITLNNSYQDLKSRYDELLDQNQRLLSTSGDATTNLQTTIAERTAAVAAREAEIRQMELDLKAREEAIARTQGRGVVTAPAAAQPASYGTVVGGGTQLNARTPLSAQSNAALRVNEIQNDVNQLLAYLPGGSYVVAPAGTNRLQITVQEPTYTQDGFTVSAAGTDLLRRLAMTLRNYPSAEIHVVGHDTDANSLQAYERSTDKAINVAQQLITYGMDPAKVIAAGQGAYAPVAANGTEAGMVANRRLDIFVTVPY